MPLELFLKNKSFIKLICPSHLGYIYTGVETGRLPYIVKIDMSLTLGLHTYIYTGVETGRLPYIVEIDMSLTLGLHTYTYTPVWKQVGYPTLFNHDLNRTF